MANFCSKCGAQLTGGKFCPECGTPVDNVAQQTDVPVQPQQTAFTQSANDTVPQNPITPAPKKNNKKGCGILIAILAVLAVFLIFISSISDDNENTKKSIKNTTTESKQEDKTISLLTENGLSNEAANSVKKDLESVGIQELSSLEVGSGNGVDDLQSFAFSGSGVSGVLTIEKNETFYISSGDIVLFDKDKGGKIDTIERYLLSDEKRVEFMVKAEEYVKQGLKAPSTAEFESTVFGDWSVSRKDDVVTVVSFVDSQNSFGAMIRDKFIVQMSYSNGDCTYLAIGDTVVFGKAS